MSHLRPPRLLAIALGLDPAPLLLPAGLLCLLLNHCSPGLPLCSVSLCQRSPVPLQYGPVPYSMPLLSRLYIHTKAACCSTGEQPEKLQNRCGQQISNKEDSQDKQYSQGHILGG